MIIVTSYVSAAPGKRDDFIAAAQACINATRKEQGCISYDLYACTDSPDKMIYVERWETREALGNHIKSPHMAAFAAIKKEQGLNVGQSDVWVYDAEEREHFFI